MPKQNKLELNYITPEEFDFSFTMPSLEVPAYMHYTFIGFCAIVWCFCKPIILRLRSAIQHNTPGKVLPPESETSDENKIDKAEFMWFPGGDYEDYMYYYVPVKRPIAKVRIKKKNFIDIHYKKLQTYCKKNNLQFKERYT